MITETVSRTIVDVLRRHVPTRGSDSVFTWLGDGETQSAHLTFAQLDQRAVAIAAQLVDRGLTNSPILLLYPPGLEFICALLGCFYAGAIAVPLYPPHPKRPDPRMQSVAADAGATVALTSQSLKRTLQNQPGERPLLAGISVLCTEDMTTAPAHWIGPTLDSNSVAYLQYTSGSTSNPRGVMISHHNLMTNLEMCERGWNASRKSVMVDWLPHFHDMGLVGGFLTGVFTGFHILKMAPIAFLRKPLAWLRAVSENRATIIGAPNFAYELCVRKATPESCNGMDLSSLDVAYCGAEPIHASTIDRFCTAFEHYGFNRKAFRPTYGLAEATVLVSIRTAHDSLQIKRLDSEALGKNRVVPVANDVSSAYRAVGCGKATLLNGRATIVDPENLMPLGQDKIGEIWACGPHVAKGYWNDSDATVQTFQAFDADGGGPFLRTGDLGFISEEELFITGRIKDLIIVRGRNVYPQDLEATAERSHPAIKLGCGIAFAVDGDIDPKIVVTIELERESRASDTEAIARSIRQAIADEHNIYVETIVFLRPAATPRTSSGKVQRRACRQAFQDGSLSEIGRHLSDSPILSFSPEAKVPTSASTPDRLINVIREEIAKQIKADVSQVASTHKISQFGLDSLMSVALQNAVESRGGVIIPIDAFIDGWTLAEIASRANPVLSMPDAPPLIIHTEDSINRMAFNVMPGRQVEETLNIKEYRVWHRYAEGRFSRSYKSEMLNSPDHLIFLTALAHAQKLAYVCLCPEFGVTYEPHAPERFKIWPTSVRVRMPALVTRTADLVQRFWVTDLRKKDEKTYFMKARTSIDSMEIDVESPIFII